MATILLSAAGAALGAGFGGTVLGLSGAVIGRAIGATLGRVIDQRIMGAGSEPVEVGRVERFRLMGAGEGAAVGQVWGRVRVAGQVIWASRFQEEVTRSGGGKGMPRPSTRTFSYSVSLAVALCEGEIRRVGRIWADGTEIEPDQLNLRVYTGSENQVPDPKIEAVEGPGLAPAYRGIAYVVIEDLDLSAYGNRVPQFSFEVVRAAQGGQADGILDVSRSVKAVCLIPGTGEYALATTRVHLANRRGENTSANVNSASGKTDFATSLDQLVEELPDCGSVSLVVSWFGDDLRAASCSLRPKVEQKSRDGVGMPWRVSGVTRSVAQAVPKVDDRAVYGGTPADRSVIEAIAAVRAQGKEVMFYPFILMDQVAGNVLPDPWTGQEGQAVLPWRGRMTLGVAPGRAGSSDRTAAAEAEVAAFFGTAGPAQFSLSGGNVTYTGPTDWGYRRFILHYAHLCAVAGGVDAFCIGSEMRALTQVRGAGDSFPAVAALRQLATDVRGILGPSVKISYAADWSEYFGYHADGNVYFHLDPLWADPAIDFVGIDNYMPLSDWRDGEDHADAAWGTIHDVGYLKSNIAGGEGFDWYYDGPEGEAAQLRKPIEDGAHGEPWVFRYKDLASWWGKAHHDRIDGVRLALPTGWIPMSKPIRFTEYGCAAIDKGSNEPNKFLDPKSSESRLPRASNGQRDDLIQMNYLRAMAEYWSDPANNPASVVTGQPMLDLARSHVWAWDTRPFPAFPGNAALWSDSVNYRRGHWLNGRAASQPLAGVVAEVCGHVTGIEPGVEGVFGIVRGYSLSDVSTARAALQPLMVAFGVDAVEREGALAFRQRRAGPVAELWADRLARSPDLDAAMEATRSAEAETIGRVRIAHVEAEGDFEIRVAEAMFPDDSNVVVAQNELPLVLTGSEARAMAERWLAEARVARDSIRFALPRSSLRVGAGDVVALEGARYRIDRIEQSDLQLAEAVRMEAGIYTQTDMEEVAPPPAAFVSPVPVFAQFLDLPLLTGEEVPHAPRIAISATPWPGEVGVWSAPQDAGYVLNTTATVPAVTGTTLTDLSASQAGLWDRGAALRVELDAGSLSSATMEAVLNGANVAAIGDGSAGNWEVFQFAEAALVAPGIYDLTLRLRGQAGSDGVMPLVWPSGSLFVLIDLATGQIDLPVSARGLERFYRIGPLARGFADPAAGLQTVAFDGIGLRPYPVAHLRWTCEGAAVRLSWVRRTRIDGDNWQSAEVPLGEDREAYQVRVLQGASLLRDVVALTPQWTYSAEMQAADGATGPISLHVAQLSERFGPGPSRTVGLVI